MAVLTNIQPSIDDLLTSYSWDTFYNLKNNILYYSLSIFNTVYDLTEIISKYACRFVNSIYREFSILGHYWIFLHDESIPIPSWYLQQVPSDYDYEYNDTVKVLHEKGSVYFEGCEDEQIRNQFHTKLNWVMASVTAYNVLKDGSTQDYANHYLDSIFDLTVIGNLDENGDYYYPTPDTILSCWSIHSGRWFNKGEKVRLEVMTRDGELLMFDNIFSICDTEEGCSRWIKAIGLSSLTNNNSEEMTENCRNTKEE